jgi:glutamate formiminotransferase
VNLVECVPNISEGKKTEVIRKIALSCERGEGVKLLHIDSNKSAHRSVITFAGPPTSMVDAAFELIKEASLQIDMTRHHGVHPRIGAVDVCPFIPLRGVSMEDCRQLSLQLGKRVAAELGFWVYLYENSATRPAYRNLANVRHGQYEGMIQRSLGNPTTDPDFYRGDSIDKKLGAMAIGARELLVAFNVNLNTSNLELGKKMASQLRAMRTQGAWRGLKALAWSMEEFDCIQISLNITDITAFSLQDIFEQIVDLARVLKISVTGSEIVGLIPEACLRKQQEQQAQEHKNANLDLALDVLHIANRTQFYASERVLERALLAKFPTLDF